MPAHLIAEEGPHRGLILNLEEGEDWIIGRDPDEADFILEDSTVSRKHARLTKAPEGIYLKNLSRVNPSLINQESHTEPVLLKEGDRVQIGHTVFFFSEEAIPELETPPKKERKKKKKKENYDQIFESEPTDETEPEENPSFVEEPLAEPELPREEANAYDTIFEDQGVEEEIPFNLISVSPLILKVISGPNTGAEIGIEKGRTYVIGKDSNSCDIVFQDLSVSRNHARLSVDEEGILAIEDLGSKNGTIINGQPVSEKQIITPQDLISLGTTSFLVIDREAPQETIYSPLLPIYEPAKEPTSTEEAAPSQEPKETEKDWKREPIPGKHLVAAGSFFVIFLIVFLSFFSLFKSKGIEVAQKEPVEEIQEALSKFSGVQFSFNPGSGKLFLVGHVLSAIDYQEMQYRIQQIPFILSTEDTVIIDEYVCKSMNDLLSTRPDWAGVSIQAVAAGKFATIGYLETGAESNSLSDYLTLHFPYLDRLENQVVVEQTLSAQIQSVLIAQGFGGITFQINNGEVIFTGNYSNTLEKEFEHLLKQMKQTPGIRSVKNFAAATSPNMTGIDLSQQYQVTGSSQFDGRGYSVVLNGKICTLGDLVDGMKITSIESNTILLEKDGLKYKIDYTR